MLDLREGNGKVHLAQVEAAAVQWALRRLRRAGKHAKPAAVAVFVARAARWLRFLGRLEVPPVVARHQHVPKVAAFADWMRRECGLSEHTIHSRCWIVDEFLSRFRDQDRPLHTLAIADLDRFVAEQSASGRCARVSICSYAKRLRIFFRYAEGRGWCAPGLAAAIMPERMYQGETVPAGLAWEDVQRLLGTTEGERPADKRDRAVVLLFAVYGLRAGEASGLRLEDIDWEQETLRVRRPKPGRTHRYPLSRSVGDALVRYLREVRPPCAERALFLTLRAPFRPLATAGVQALVSRRLRRLGVVSQRRGPHALRHALRVAPVGPRAVVQGDRRPSRASQPDHNGGIRQGRSRRTAPSGGHRPGVADMTLAEVVDQYIAWRQARGAHFRSGASILHLYCRSVGGEVGCDAAGTEQARAFLAGNGFLTRYRANKRTVLVGFYRYAISRGHATHSPLPADEPKEPPSAPAYIYSRDELRRLFDAVDGCRKRAVQLQAHTFRALLLLLYGAGLRGGEALRLTRADVDLSGALLTVRETKFRLPDLSQNQVTLLVADRRPTRRRA